MSENMSNSQGTEKNISVNNETNEANNIEVTLQDAHEALNRFLQSNDDAREIIMDENFIIYYFKTLTDKLQILHELKQMYFRKDFDFENYFPTIAEIIQPKDTIGELFDGHVIVFYKNQFYSIPGPESKEGRSVSSTVRESSLEGGLIGFVEQMGPNINLIRQEYLRPSLETELMFVGTYKSSKITIIYDNKLVDKNILCDVRNILQNIQLPVVQAANQLAQHIVKYQWLIPRILTTERPDRVIQNLVKGRIIIVLQGTPAVLILPASFHDFFATVDDRYMLPIPSFFLIVLRYLALSISILFPSSYVAFTAYNPEVYRVELALSIAGSRSNVPYPAFIEVIFMLVMMEFLIEASVRLPKTVGQAAATVGGLILGQAATQAQLVSNIMIIVVAAVAISNFVIPITSMGLVVRVSKYILLFFASIGGMYGLLLGLIGFVYYLFSINSFTQSFLNPVGIDFSQFFSRLKRGNF